MDGAYDSMLERIASFHNPSLFVLGYSNDTVNSLFVVPSYFFTSDLIEKRRPLAPTARRAGWTGCNIVIGKLPECSKVYLIRNGRVFNRGEVVTAFRRTLPLEMGDLENRGWMLDVLKCIERIPGSEFSLQQVYAFETELGEKYPGNHFIKDKIRQQLQVLRDRGVIAFTSRGHYKKLI